MINTIGEVVAKGFIGGITAGTVVFIMNWVLSSAMNILKFTTKGE